MTATFGMADVLHVRMGITVSGAAIAVDRTVSDVQTIITVADVHLDIGVEIAPRHVAVAV